MPDGMDLPEYVDRRVDVGGPPGRQAIADLRAGRFDELDRDRVHVPRAFAGAAEAGCLVAPDSRIRARVQRDLAPVTACEAKIAPEFVEQATERSVALPRHVGDQALQLFVARPRLQHE